MSGLALPQGGPRGPLAVVAPDLRVGVPAWPRGWGWAGQGDQLPPVGSEQWAQGTGVLLSHPRSCRLGWGTCLG